ncbi:MAG: thymidine phosphorylase [Candidatus Eremiobacteraeota bacterium]|nr:thymidine phosphorylase [Candidatus Eremiobacteraeota bacterium]MCW5869999.1 thymidine phosphorylase [Candidatus Eremiobacteraeota bacterium]
MLHPVQLILKKRNGDKHTPEEIRFLIEELSSGRLENYQLAAWLMAVWFRGMDHEETDVLTQAMIESGDQVDLSSIEGVKVDKHSTGGVGDGTTLVVAPIVAAAGGRVAKMSGRGLGHTGGTLDKLEAIPGMRVDLSQNEFLEQVRKIGLAVISQTGKLVPADGAMYALRDVTGTVDSIPLIAASVMSKKLACGADAIVLDVKFGHGAFMKEFADARKLAETMVAIGRLRGRQVRAALSSMEEPLGSQIGNALEVDEGIRILRGERPGTGLEKVACELAAHLVEMSSRGVNLEAARQRVAQIVSSGQALQKLGDMIEAQGGDRRVCDDPGRLPQTAHKIEFKADKAGFLGGLAAETIGTAAMWLGAGRRTKSDQIDPAVGIVLQVEKGDPVEVGQTLATLHVNDQTHLGAAQHALHGAFHIVPEPPRQEPLIRDMIL